MKSSDEKNKKNTMFALMKILFTALPIVVDALEKDLWASFKQRDGEIINKTNLLNQYKELYPIAFGRGTQLDPNLFSSGQLPEVCYDNLSCHCDGKCCVESALSYLKIIHIGTEVYSLRNKGKMYLLVNECPYDYIDKIQQKCTETGILPVTSAYSGISYKNQYCALCHGENETVEWKLGLTCPNGTKTDTQEYSSCVIEMFLEDSNLVASDCLIYKYEMNSEQIISSCNETGMWSNYDGDIDWACSRFYKPFSQFRNIYCYICNPSIEYKWETTLIDACSYTATPISLKDDAESFNKSEILDTMCKTAAAVPRLSPFKNAFCFVCNKPITIEKYADIGEVEVIEVLRKELLLKITINSNDTNLTAEIFKSKMKNLLNEVLNKTIDLKMNKRQNKLKSIKDSNASYIVSEALLRIYKNVCTEDYICTQSIYCTYERKMHVPCDKCTCHQNCLIDKVCKCCFNKLLDFKPLGCFKESMFSVLSKGSSKNKTRKPKSFKLVDQCLSYKLNDSDTENCLDGDISDIWKGIPVHSSAREFFPFKNIFCLLCNEAIPKHSVHVYLKVECRHNFDLDLFISLIDFFNSIQDKGCRVFFTTAERLQFNEECELDVDNIQTTDKEFVCFGKPRLKGRGKDVYKLCTEKDHIPHIVKDLIQLHVIPFYNNKEFRTFKNAYRISTVVQCRGKKTLVISSEHFCFFKLSIYEGKDTGQKHEINQRLDYRTLFTVSSSELQRFKLLNDGGVCPVGTFDTLTRQCRHVFCNDGRLLQSGSCVNVFESVYDTAFLVDLLLQPCDFYVNENENNKTDQYRCRSIYPKMQSPNDMFLSPADVCSKINQTIRNMLSDATKILYIQCHFTLYPYKKNFCGLNESDETFNHTWIVTKNTVIHANITVHVEFSDNRTNTEIQLYDFKKHIFFQVPGGALCSTAQNNFQNEEASDEHNYFIPEGYVSTHHRSENVVVIKKTLFCPVVEITVSFLTVNQSAGIVLFTISAKDISFNIRDVDIFRDGNTKWRLRLCESDIEQLKRSKNNIQPKQVDKVYFLFSTFCNILSLLSLLLTLLTYILFRVLRTLPGCNNMSLAFCLLLAQSSLQYSYISPSFRSKIHCQILGMFIHYFWLGTFCALNVCSFHMYRVFSGMLMSRFDNEMIVFLRYNAYVYGFPAFIVSAVALGNMVTRDNIGYGEIRCFLDDFYSVLFSFLTPACLIFISNVIFYGITFYKIKSSPTMRRNTEERNKLRIYVRLCTITGIAWPLLFVDALFSLSFVSYLVTFINAMQGFFIFISFICNKRVLDLYKGYVFSMQERNTAVSGVGTFANTRSVQRQ